MATGVGPPAGNRCRQEDDDNDRREQPPNPPIRSAKPSVKPHDGGYDCEFLERPSSKLVQADCPICLLVLREPHQVTCCGYSFCRGCIQRVRDAQNACPTCGEEIISYPNIGLKRTLLALIVRCSRRGLGCEWEGELGELDRHLNQHPPLEKLLEGCQFSDVECTVCLQPFQRRYLKAHQSEDCPKRPFACQHCKQHEATFEEVTQSHWPECPSFPLPCPNNCDLVLQRHEVEQHIRQNCTLALLHCDFHRVGCEVHLPRRDMPSHISENIAGHMSHLEVYMSIHPGENVGTCMALMVGTIQKVSIENVRTLSQLQESHYQLCEAHDQFCELRNSHDQLLKSQKEVNQQLAKKLEQSHEKISQLERAIATQNTHSEKQEKRIDAEHVAMTQSHEIVSQQVSGLQESLAQQKDELTTMMKSSEEKLEKSLATTETKFQTSLATSETKFQRYFATSENKLHASLAMQQEKKHQENTAAVMAIKNDLSRKIAASERNIRSQQSTLSLHQQTLDKVMGTGKLSFDFTFIEFKSKKENDVDWYSPPFYTHTHGYRMCIRVDANGSGVGEGTHISVYAYLMKGPFDNYLEWPFQGTITIQLLNQLKDVNHHTSPINFSNTTDPAIIGRVSSGERARGGLGASTFLPHAKLALKLKDDCQYLKDDQLKFRVSS